MGEDRNPFQVYLLTLGCWGALTVISPGEAASGSIEKVLHEPFETLWGLTLLAGCGSTLLGMFWQGDARTGLVIKRAGLMILVYPVIIFAFVVWVISGWGGTIVAMTLIGFAFSAALQARKVSRRINVAIKNGETDDGRYD